MFFLLGNLSIISALIGFLIISDPQNPQIAGVDTSFDLENQTKISPPSPTNTTIENKQTISDLIIIQEKSDEIIIKDNQNVAAEEADINSNNFSESPDLLSQVNNFRSGKGLSHLEANSETCFFASMRAQEISSAFNHDGFNSRVNSNSLPYPSYSEVTENIALNPDPNAVVNAWINSPGHNENMSKNIPFGCVASNGHYYVFEAWKP